MEKALSCQPEQYTQWKELFTVIQQAFLVKRFFVGGPPNISGGNSFLNASPYYQLPSWTYLKSFRYQVLSGTTENSGFSDI